MILTNMVNKEHNNKVLESCGVKTVFAQNAKMKRSSIHGIHLYNFGIPAFKSNTGLLTCPKASECVRGCYARQGTYTWNTTQNAYENRLKLTQHDSFREVIVYQIDRLLTKHKNGQVVIRIHDAGDFYNAEYAKAWFDIAANYKNNNRVVFYAYTKMVSMFKKELKDLKPDNLTIIFSLGGKEDSFIDQLKDRHSRVFKDETELTEAGYINATGNDMDALLPNQPLIGLVYHGVKGYGKTNWNRVK